MSEESAPRHKGRFAKGHSGNAQGARIRRPKKLMTYEDVCRTILEVVGSEVDLEISGQHQRMNYLKLSMVRLVTGRANERLCASNVIDLAKRASIAIDRIEQAKAEAKRKAEVRRDWS